MTTRRSALGRGLGALIPSAGPKNEETAPAQTGGALELEISHIDPNPDQPRRVFDPVQLARLADSVRRHGVLQPVVVRRAAEGRYELLVGERRWRAAQAAGRTTIPAVVADVAPQDRLELALIENVQRHDLNPIELALAFRALSDAGLTQEEIGARVGFDRSSVANHLRLLELARELQGDVESGRLSMGHAKALLQLPNPERRRHLRDLICQQELSVRAAEETARRLAGPEARRRPARPAAGPAADPNLARLTDALRDRLKTRVRISGTADRGRVEIEYFGAAELDRILNEILGGAF
jgi:ParB family chromosome partitioning protein